MAETKTVTYKEKRGRSLFVPGYGISDNNGLLVTTNQTPLENPNFERVVDTPAPPPAPPVAPASPTPPAPEANPQPQTKE